MLKICTLSGYEGAGKSHLITHFQKQHRFNVIPETARLIMPLETNVMRESRDDLSYKSFISYLTNIHFMLSNNLQMNVISDRNLVDSLTYLKLYSDDQTIYNNDVSDFIRRFLDENQREFFYDEMVLITHSKDDKQIEQILSDPERKYGRSIEQYKRDSTLWENIYQDIAGELLQAGLAPSLRIVQAYPDNLDVVTDVEKLFLS